MTMKIKLSTNNNNTPTTEHDRSHSLNHKNYNDNMNKMNNPETHQQMMSQQMMNQTIMKQQMMNQQMMNQQMINQQMPNQSTSNYHSNLQTPLQTDLPERQSPTTPTGNSIDLSSSLPSPPKIMVSDLHLQPGQAPLASPRAVRAFSLTQDMNYQKNVQQQPPPNSHPHQNTQSHNRQAIQTTQLKQQQRPTSAVQSSSSSDSDSSSDDEEDEKLKQRRLQSRSSIACAELSEIAKLERSYRGFNMKMAVKLKMAEKAENGLIWLKMGF